MATTPDSRDVSLTIPAKPDYLVLARLALAAVCRLTPLSPEEVADLKLAVTEAAADFVDERARGRPRRRGSTFPSAWRRSGSCSCSRVPTRRVAAGRAGARPRDHRRDGRRVRLRARAHSAREAAPGLRLGSAALQCSSRSPSDTRVWPTTPIWSGGRWWRRSGSSPSELEGLKVLHLSATAFGGGVSEILYTLVPLMLDVGIEAEWHVMLGREEFYNATKRLHNALQGDPSDLTPEEVEVYERYNELNAKEVTGGWDVIIVHDPQPAADPPARAREGHNLDLALPHRPLDPEPLGDRAAGSADRRVRAGRLPHGAVRARAGFATARSSRSCRRRSTRCRRRTWRSPPRTPPSCATSSASTSTGR